MQVKIETKTNIYFNPQTFLRNLPKQSSDQMQDNMLKPSSESFVNVERQPLHIHSRLEDVVI